MARTIAEIEQQIIDSKNGKPELSGLSSTSATAIWRLWVTVVAICIWTIENLFDEHKNEVTGIIATQKPHTAQWYGEKVRAFQYGYALVPEKDYYDNTELDEETISASQVVKYAAPVETATGLRIKIATEESGDLAPLGSDEFDALVAYMQLVKDSGVKLAYTNSVADSLKLNMKVYVDPLVLDNSGRRRDGTSDTPVQDAIRDYLKTKMSFNGWFVLLKLVDRLQQVPGVVIPHVIQAQAKYGMLAYADVDVKYRPDSGYLRLVDSDLTIEFIASEPI